MRNIFKKILISIQCLLGFIIILIVCIPILPLPIVSYCSFFSVGFPYLILIQIIFLIFWLVVKPIFSTISIFFCLISWQQFGFLIGFHPLRKFAIIKNHTTDFRIANWNIKSFNGNEKHQKLQEIPQLIFNSVEKYNPDIICLQEFNNNINTNQHINLFTKQYPFYYYSKDYVSKNEKYNLGCIIFSKYKIIGSNKNQFPNGESIIYIDIVKNNDTIRIFNTHLQSFKLKPVDFNTIDEMVSPQKNSFHNIADLGKKLFNANKRRYIQSGIVKKQLDSSPYPFVLAGDFNDVPNSYTYYRITKGLQDAFLFQSFGLGTTYNNLLQTLRIDYILTNKKWDIKQYINVDKNVSDHSLLVADLSLKK